MKEISTDSDFDENEYLVKNMEVEMFPNLKFHSKVD